MGFQVGNGSLRSCLENLAPWKWPLGSGIVLNIIRAHTPMFKDSSMCSEATAFRSLRFLCIRSSGCPHSSSRWSLLLASNNLSGICSCHHPLLASAHLSPSIFNFRKGQSEKDLGLSFIEEPGSAPDPSCACDVIKKGGATQPEVSRGL